MSVTIPENSAQESRRVWGKRVVWLLIPLLTLGYQIAAKNIADSLIGHPLTAGWIESTLVSPWFALLMTCEIASLIVWMIVLSEIKLSAAFPMTAFAYILVIGVSWTVFHEPADILTVLGSAAILSGVWLIGREPEDPSP
jgi:drug/metabolite transporter (DMT)-like permease